MSGNVSGKCQGILNRLKCGNPEYIAVSKVILVRELRFGRLNVD